MPNPARPWRAAWEQALYGPGGFFLRDRPAEHFRTSVTSSRITVVLSWPRRIERMGWAMFAIVAATTATGFVVTALLVSIDSAMAAARIANPVTVAIVDTAAAGVSMLTALARVLIVVAIYRRLARQGM